MKKILLLLFLSSFIKATTLNLGLVKTEALINETYLKLITEILQKKWTTQKIKINVKVLDDEEALNMYKNKKINILITVPSIYFKHETLIENSSQAKYFMPINEEIYEQYYLIANKDSIAPMKNLNHHVINLMNGFQGARVWFETFVYENKKKPLHKSIKSIVRKNKETEILYKVFFDKNHLGVISKATYNLMRELNPQIKKKIKVLAKSSNRFISIFTLVHKDVSKYDHNRFRNLMNSMGEVLGNSKDLPFVLVDELMSLKKSDINYIKLIYKKHQNLKKKYQ